MSSFGTFGCSANKGNISILTNIQEVHFHLVGNPGEVRVNGFWIYEGGLVRDVKAERFGHRVTPCCDLAPYYTGQPT